ncbi:MAG: hypothetical protein ABIK65_01895 [Candidatus Eisenbacteria bacterium]
MMGGGFLTGRAGAFAMILAAALFLACGDDDNPADAGDPGPELPKTPAELITEFFPAAYASMDSAAYAAILDEDYRFELIPGEVDPDDPNPWWNLEEEMKIAGNMFNARYNEEGQRVDRIKLQMTERSNVVDNTPYPNKPSGEEWREVTALVDLLVVIDDPDDPEGVTIFVIGSDQLFTVRPSRTDSTAWTVYKQIDQEPINKTGSTADASWSGVKSLFR